MIDTWIAEACKAAGLPPNNFWIQGYKTLCGRESSHGPNAINVKDSNAHGPIVGDGFPQGCSRGVAQCIPSTFAAYHVGQTAKSIYDPVANIAASMKYVCHRYHVSEDGSDLAAKVQQADPTRPPLGYGGEPLREPSPYIDSIVTQLAEVETAQAEKAEEDDLPKRAGAEVFVRVHYATDRALAGRTGPNHYYGSERGDLRYGYAIVSIPAGHAMGEMERPTIWRMEFRENVESHVVLRDLRELDHTQFFDELHSEIEHTKESAAFVFIHGFNVTFAAAARRAAQMAYDLFLIGQQRGLATLSTVPILYSWPSKGGLLGTGDYFHDAADSEASGGGHLKAFLNEVATLSGAASLTIVAHSMGCRALTTALSHIGLGMPLGAKPLVKEIILAAPDIDRDVFLNVADAVTRTGQRVTLYASNRDRALKASKAAHGFPRLGDATGGVTVFAGAESIDASVVGEEILAHSYYGETSVLCDLYYLISQSASPNHRFGLIAQGTPPNNHWIMRARK